jgi:hypothetical protein
VYTTRQSTVAPWWGDLSSYEFSLKGWTPMKIKERLITGSYGWSLSLQFYEESSIRGEFMILSHWA